MKKYIPLIQQPYCCVPTCIQMILLRRNIHFQSQEEIGYALGLVVPLKDRRLFQKVRIGKKLNAGWGTQVEKRNYSINEFFRKNKIRLKEEYTFLTKPKEVRRFLEKNIKNKDIIVCFDYKTLYGAGENVGHVSIIENIKGNFLTLIDPLYLVPKYRRVSLGQLSNAIKVHKKRRGGFWVIS